MKKLLIIISLAAIAPTESKAQTQAVTQLILNLEKLRQLRKTLQELKKGYEILFEGYTKIRDISQGNFKLHQAFLDGLLQASPSVKSYGRIKDIVQIQLAIVSQCKNQVSRFAQSGQLTQSELQYLESVASQMLLASLKNLDALTDILTANKLRASDYERLTMIDAIYDDMAEKLTFISQFNSQSAALVAQRRDEANQIKLLESLYHLQP